MFIARCRLLTTTTKTLQLREAFRRAFVLGMANQNNYQIKEVEGDLFSAPKNYSLAHCVGADLAMAAGIAVKFKQVYGKVDELRAQKAATGQVAVLKDNERFIYYLVTKPNSWDTPTYDTLKASLLNMREHMRQNGIKHLAIPRIGCGIDGLEWNKVNDVLKQTFGEDDMELVVYNFVPPTA